MITLHNGTPFTVSLSDGAVSISVPPGYKPELQGTNTWAASLTNALDLELPASGGTYSATLATTPTGALALVNIQEANLSGYAMMGLALTLSLGLPVLALRWFQRISSARVED